jgi:hypothetical protein
MPLIRVASLFVSILFITGCGSLGDVVQSAETPIKVSTDPRTDSQLIQDLYESLNENFAYGSQDGFDTVLDATYPGSVNKEISKSCIEMLVDTELQWFFSPNLSTLRQVEGWVVPDIQWDQGEWLFAGQTPKGRTYEMEVSGERIHKGELIASPSGTLHFTILDNKAYMFTSLCGSGW